MNTSTSKLRHLEKNKKAELKIHLVYHLLAPWKFFSGHLSSTCILRDVISQDDIPGGLDTPDFNKSNQMRMLLILNPTNFGFFPV